MRKLYSHFLRLPIKWKLAIWSTFLLTLLFFLYNSLQYIVINRWIYGQAESQIEQTINDIKDYYSDKGNRLNESDIRHSHGFLKDINEKGQIIWIVDEHSNPIVRVSNQMPLNVVKPEYSPIHKIKNVINDDDTHLLIVRAPLKSAYFTGTIEIVRNQAPTDELVDNILLILFAASLSAIILNGLGGYILSRQLLMPIQSITETMQRIHEEDLSKRFVFYDNGDELSRLGHIFNQMMNRLEASFHQQKQFVEDASHELRTPVAIIEGHLSLLARWGKKDPRVLEESLEASLEEIRRLASLVEELLHLNRTEDLSFKSEQTQNPAAVISGVCHDFHSLHPDFVFEQHLASLEDISLPVSAEHLKQILIILLDNAVKYSKDDKRVVVTGKVTDEGAHLLIQDFGLGIPAEDLPRIFDRFYRVNKDRSRERGGNGLGLSIAKRLIERAHGTIEITSEENEGTTITLTFPIEKPNAAAPEQPDNLLHP
ncbi:HAMP domain-containing sensor histidine kinase [Aneurinibacillus terranovensis]|uniref:HAMP domain-containing sensor histidine kinase n=1 Tax=Aneurinibacillus terranovensis TaxID=278991 RepID=UPI000686EEFC|nr:ATP-binding protein [Aneurinibacillus terranovensis]